MVVAVGESKATTCSKKTVINRIKTNAMMVATHTTQQLVYLRLWLGDVVVAKLIANLHRERGKRAGNSADSTGT